MNLARGCALSLAPLVALALPAAGGAAVHYVAPGGVNTGDCTQPASPCAHPQRAVLNSSPGDEIRVAGGTYLFSPGALDTCGPSPPAALGAPAIVCVVNRQLTIRGGYSPDDWTRPWAGGTPTVFDGENLRRGVVVARTASPTSLVLEAVTIRRGRGVAHVGESPPNSFGGGMEAIQANLTLRAVLFEDNSVVGTASSGDMAWDAAGGGLALRSPLGQQASTANLEDVLFFGNSSIGGTNTGVSGRSGYGHGGGLFTYGYQVTGTRLEFEGNEAHGGAASASDGRASDGRQGDGLGGALSCELGSQVTLTGSRIVQNLAAGGAASPSLAGALASGAFGGGLFGEGDVSFPTAITLIDTEIAGNQAVGGAARSGGLSRGGGLMVQEASLDLERSRVIDNRAQGGAGNASGSGTCSAGEAARGAADGGGLTASRLTAANVQTVLRNGIVAANSAAMGATGCITGGGGGGLAFQGLTAQLTHLTVAGNQVETFMVGQGLLVFGSPFSGVPGATVHFDFGVLADHTAVSDAAAHVQASATGSGELQFGPTLVASNFQDVAGGGVVLGLGNLVSAASPRFAAPGAPSYDYHLEPDSQAVDAATGSAETVDFEGQSRAETRDLGGDELGRPQPIFADGFESGTPCLWNAPC